MHKRGESETIQIMTATVHHVTSTSGLRKFHANGFLLNNGYKGKHYVIRSTIYSCQNSLQITFRFLN